MSDILYRMTHYDAFRAQKGVGSVSFFIIVIILLLRAPSAFAFAFRSWLGQKWEISRQIPILSNSDHVVPTAYDDTAIVRPILPKPRRGELRRVPLPELSFATSRLCSSSSPPKSNKTERSQKIPSFNHVVSTACDDASLDRSILIQASSFFRQSSLGDSSLGKGSKAEYN